MSSTITVKNAILLCGFLISVAGLPLSIWWLLADTSNREPIVAIVVTIGALITTAVGITWSDLFESGQEHDRALFKKLDEILSEACIQSVVDRILTTQLRISAELEACHTFEYLCSQDSHRFISKKLDATKNDLLIAIRELDAYTGTHFFLVSENVYRLYPKLMEELEDGDVSAHSRFDKHAKELERLCTNLQAAYSKFRITVKQKLKL